MIGKILGAGALLNGVETGEKEAFGHWSRSPGQLNCTPKWSLATAMPQSVEIGPR